MRVGLDISSIAHGAGIGRYTAGLATSLAEVALQPGSALDLVFFSRRPLPAGLDESAFRPVTLVYLPGNRVLYEQARLPRTLRSAALDVFHSPDYILPMTDYGIPSVVTVHDLSFYDRPESVSLRALWLYRRFLPPSLNKAQVILADSEFTAGRIRERFPDASAKVRVLYPGITSRIGEVSPGADRIEQPPNLLFVGTIEPRKNLPLALAVFRTLRESMPDLTLRVIGRRGRGGGRIISEMRRTKGVQYIAEANDRELETYYRGADALLYPSLYEGFGYPPVEAMAWGCPVVASNSSSLPESVNGAGLLVEPTHDAFVAACRRVFNEKDLREDLAKRGIEQAKKFRWENNRERILEIYKEAIRRFRSR